jgi:hypothetical protein
VAVVLACDAAAADVARVAEAVNCPSRCATP